MIGMLSVRTGVAFGLLVALYISVRLFNLTIIPIENDEASYIYVAHLVQENFSLHWDESFAHWVMSVPPLFVWWAGFWLARLADPLVAGRVASVTGGVLTLLGTFWIARRLFSLPVAVIASLLLIVSPLHLDSDRKAVTDTLMGGWFTLLIALLVQMARDARWTWSVLAGTALALSSWTKQTGLLGFTALPLAFLFLPWRDLAVVHKGVYAKVVPLGVLLVTAAGLAYFLIALQGISPKLSTLQQRTSGIVTGVGGKSLLDDPLVNARVNIPNTLEIFWKYYSLPAIFVYVVGLGYAVFRRHEPSLALAISFVWLLTPIIFLGLPYGSKYVYFATVPFLVSLAFFCWQLPAWIKQRFTLSVTAARILLIGVVVTPLLLTVRMLLVDPIDPQMYHVDNRYYFDGSGYGVPELIAAIKQKKKQYPHAELVVLAEGISGHLWHTLSVYFWKDPQIKVVAFERSLNFLKTEGEIEDYLIRTVGQAKTKLPEGSRLFLATNGNLSRKLNQEGITLVVSTAKPPPPEPNFWRDVQYVDYAQYKGFHVDLYEVK